jgi:hypothetical protein
VEKIYLAVHEFIADLIAEKVWGSVTFSFEAGEIKAIHQDLVWKPKDICEAYAGQGGVRKDAPAKTGIKKRLVIKPGSSGGSMS